MLQLPALAAWRHLGAREGFEVVFLRREGAFDLRAILTYDRFGLALDYPGIAERVA